MTDTQETKKYTVTGMTCGHCEMSVQEEISEVPGVTSVTASHQTGEVTVTGANFTDAQVADAVTEAGFTLAQ